MGVVMILANVWWDRHGLNVALKKQSIARAAELGKLSATLRREFPRSKIRLLLIDAMPKRIGAGIKAFENKKAVVEEAKKLLGQ